MAKTISFYSHQIVKEFERAVIMRLGRILHGGAKGPGLFFILPCIDSILTLDLRTITFDVPPQEILTKGTHVYKYLLIIIFFNFDYFKDSVTITVDAVCYFRVFNPVISVINVENAQVIYNRTDALCTDFLIFQNQNF